MGKVFKENKIEQVYRASAINSLWKIFQELIITNCKRNHVIAYNVYEKTSQSHDSQNFESIHVLFEICTLVSQSESYNFFMYILTIISKGLFNTPKKGLTSFGKSRQICCSIHRFCTATTLSIGSFRAQEWQWWWRDQGSQGPLNHSHPNSNHLKQEQYKEIVKPLWKWLINYL